MRVISSRPLLLHGDDALITNIAQRLQTALTFVPVLFAHTCSDSGKTQNSQLMNLWWALGGFVLGYPIKS